MTFLLVIDKDSLYTYEKLDQEYRLLYLEGSESFPYTFSCLEDDMRMFLNELSNEKNLVLSPGERPDLEFEVLSGTDRFTTERIMQELSLYNPKALEFNEILMDVIRQLRKDKDLKIEEYGINYGASSFHLRNGKLVRQEFDLLAYTLCSNDIVRLLKIK